MNINYGHGTAVNQETNLKRRQTFRAAAVHLALDE
jgi:hypothetical protein